MPKYEIFAGLSSQVESQGIYECRDEDTALGLAWEFAIDEYTSYEGYHGMMDRQQIIEDYVESFGEMPTEEEIDERYSEEVSSYMNYYVRLVET